MNVQEVLNIAKERKNKNKDIIKKVTDNIHKKIKYYANLKRDSCSYTIPPIVEDRPLYDFDNVIKEVFKVLDQEGFIVSAYCNGQIDICWNEKLVEEKIKKDKYLLLLEEKKLQRMSIKSKQIEERYSFLANPKKTGVREKSLEEKLDEQVEKILHEKDKLQKKYSRLIQQ